MSAKSLSEKEYTEFLAFFILNSALLFLYGIPAACILLKNRGILDVPSQVNMFVYVLSFLTKTMTWAVMVLVFDTGDSDTDRLKQGGFLFIIDYLAGFAVKISIFLFIFEMMHVRTLIASQNPE
jgi:hypothetical protein